ncbi:MAG: hypothetical protein GY769_08090 [bacterium]|nr:hypothetical protein [bacterium]
MTSPADRILKNAGEALAHCQKAEGAKNREDRELYQYAAITKLVAALDAVPELRDPDARKWNQGLWEEQQQQFRDYLKKREERGDGR